MAKLQAYKFVNPGVSNLKSPTVAAARKQTLALNRLGGTISSIGTLVSDIERISIRQIKNDKLRAKAERRRDRRELDQAAEEAIENKKATSKTKPKLGKTSLKIAKGGLSWIEKFLAPIGKFLGWIAKIAITKEVLEWASDPANIEKLSVFLEKTHFVFSKLFGWAAGFTNNILDGFSALTDPNGTFIERLGGLGSIMKGLIGLKYLMNPFSIITDILWLVDLLTGDRGNNRRGGNKNNRNRNKNRNQNRNLNKNRKPGSLPGKWFRPKVTTSGGQSVGPLRGIREWLRKTRKFLGQKPNISVGGNTGGNWLTKLFRGKPVVSTSGATKANWLQKLFQGKAHVTTGTGGVKGNWLQRLFKSKADPTKITQGMGGKSGGNWLKNLFSGSKVTTGTGGLKVNWLSKLKSGASKIRGATPLQAIGYLAADYTINYAADKLIFEPMKRASTKKLHKQIEEAIAEHGVEKVLANQEAELAKEQSKTPLNMWANMATLGYGNIFVGPNTRKVQHLQNVIGYINNRGEDSDKKVELKKDPQIKKKGNWFSNLFGGKKEETPKKQEIKKTEKKSGNWFSNIFGGGKKQEKKKEKKTNWWSGLFSKKKPEKEEKKKKGWWPFAEGGELPEYFLGGLFKGVKKAVSGVWKGVTKIASNPIVGTALSFIPGMQIPMAIVNGVNSAMNGDIMGALSAGLSGLGQFANINTVNAISQPQWLQNLRFSGFGQGVANMYHSGANAWGALTSGFNNFMGSKWGQIGQQVLGGDYMGALNTFNPKWGGIASDIMSGNYGGALSAFNPEMGAMVTKGMAMIDSFRQDPMGLISQIAEQQGMGGVLKAVTGLFGGGDKITAMTQIASEMGIDPKILGAVKSTHQQALKEGGISAQYAMEQAMEFIPIPTIIEKIVTIPQAVAINTGGGTQIIVSAPNSLLERSK